MACSAHAKTTRTAWLARLRSLGGSIIGTGKARGSKTLDFPVRNNVNRSVSEFKPGAKTPAEYSAKRSRAFC